MFDQLLSIQNQKNNNLTNEKTLSTNKRCKQLTR